MESKGPPVFFRDSWTHTCGSGNSTSSRCHPESFRCCRWPPETNSKRPLKINGWKMKTLLSRKLTCPLKINVWKMYFLLKQSLFGGDMFVFKGVRLSEFEGMDWIFRGWTVSFRECFFRNIRVSNPRSTQRQGRPRVPSSFSPRFADRLIKYVPQKATQWPENKLKMVPQVKNKKFEPKKRVALEWLLHEANCGSRKGTNEEFSSLLQHNKMASASLMVIASLWMGRHPKKNILFNIIQFKKVSM